LYKDDGSNAPTRLATGLSVSGIIGANGVSLPALGGYLYFITSASDPQTGQSTQALDRTDGTAAPAQVFSAPGDSGPSGIRNLTVSGDYLYFTNFVFNPSAHTTTEDLYAYKADGSTGAPTQLATNLSGVSNLTAAGGSLYYTAASTSVGTSSPETLYQISGTAAPTQLAANLTGVANLTPVGRYLFFTTSAFSPSTFTNTTSLYAYKADGSSGAPTQLASNLSGALNPLVPLGNKVYFTVTVTSPTTTQTSLYSSDGTAAGTNPLPGGRLGPDPVRRRTLFRRFGSAVRDQRRHSNPAVRYSQRRGPDDRRQLLASVPVSCYH
jgi:hypothetical protein